MVEAKTIKGKNVLLRADLDVPMEDKKITNFYRLQQLLPTLKLCRKYANSTLIIGHNGRPVGEDLCFSLKSVKEWLERSLNQSIYFISSGFYPGEWNRAEFSLALMENLRFSEKEKTLSREFALQIAAGSEIYVYDAFAAYHPSTSLQKIPEILPTLTGIQFDLEIATLSQAIKASSRPRLLILSGAKPDKLEYLSRLSSKFDQIILGGKLASRADLTSIGLDLNPQAVSVIRTAIAKAKTIVLNGPLGKYELPEGANATREVFKILKSAPGRVIVGGGDTLSAITALGFQYSDFNFVSTGGGAMLEFMATLTHPLLEILTKKSVNLNL